MSLISNLHFTDTNYVLSQELNFDKTLLLTKLFVVEEVTTMAGVNEASCNSHGLKLSTHACMTTFSVFSSCHNNTIKKKRIVGRYH